MRDLVLHLAGAVVAGVPGLTGNDRAVAEHAEVGEGPRAHALRPASSARTIAGLKIIGRSVMDEPSGASDRYSTAQLRFAVQRVAAIAGEIRRCGETDARTDKEVCRLMNQMLHAADMMTRQDITDEAEAADHLLGVENHDR
jgi:hypothetical protein